MKFKQAIDITINTWLDSEAVEVESLDLCSIGSKKCQIAIDTGTSMMGGPNWFRRKLINSLNIMANCTNKEQLPDLGFVINDGADTLYLSPQDYIDEENGYCTLSFMTLHIPPPRGPLFILGEPFLNRFYTVFDVEHERVGFAPHKAPAAAAAAVVDARANASSVNVTGTLQEGVCEAGGACQILIEP